jgi:hypothetical protein
VNSQATIGAVPSPSGSPPATSATAVVNPSPGPAATRAAVATPSLKPGEVITWVKLDRPKLALGQIVVGSFALAGLVLLISMAAGIVLGYFRSKSTSAHGTGGLRLR